MSLILTLVFCTCTRAFFTNDVQRIIGGKACEIEAHPFMVYLQGKSVCGGSLLTLSYILTAAHCVINNEDMVKNGKLSALAGCTHAEHSQSVSRRIEWAKKHPAFGDQKLKSDLRYDIGIMKTEKKFEESNTVIPVHIYRKFHNDCQEAQALGWGMVNKADDSESGDDEAASRKLHCVNLPIISLADCKELWPAKYQLDDTIMCTMQKEGGKDACYGDSGGPLVCRTAQIGIISAGLGCAEANSPALFTRLDAFTKFIADTADVRFISVAETGGNEIVRAVEKEANHSTRFVPIIVLVPLLLGLRTLSILLMLPHLCIGDFVDYDDLDPKCSVEEHPYMVSLMGSVPCGGSLITMEYIVTSAFCVRTEEISKGYVYAFGGRSFQVEYYATVRRSASRMVVSGVRHPLYQPIRAEQTLYDLRYDLGVVKVIKPFIPSPVIQSIPLMNASANCTPEAVGWNGRNAHPIPLEVRRNYSDFFTTFRDVRQSVAYENHLKCVEVEVMFTNACEKLWPSPFLVNDSVICTVVSNDSLDWGLCAVGGYGGALVCDGELMGVISTGLGCPRSGLPEIVTPIEIFISFIVETIHLPVEQLLRKGNVTTVQKNNHVMHNVSHVLLLLLIWLMLVVW